MIRKKNETLEWLEFELLANEPYLVHGVFLRQGGVSEGPYFSLNFFAGTGDTAKNVDENKRRLLKALKLEKLMTANHVHGSHVEWVKQQPHPIPPSDGLMTSEKNLGLITTHADCQAAIFFDPIHQAIASVHAGWRGQVQNIYKKTLLKMGEVFHTKPQDLLVAISPSLGPQNAEFKNFQNEFPREFWEFQIRPTYFDLWAIARYQLQTCGVLPHHIQIAEMDTFANPQDFFSYRREKCAGAIGKITGCHGTIVALKSF